MSAFSPKPLWRRLTAAVLYISFCLIFLTMGTALGWISQSPVLSGIIKGKLGGAIGLKAENPFPQDSLMLLVLGCDEDWYFGGKQLIRHQARSDMMLLCKLDFKNHRITGMSIPRDTLVAADGHGEQKINAYHLYGNDASKVAVEALLPGVTIDRVMALNYDAFKKMVDVIGGVDVFVPKDMNYDDNRGHLHIHLKAGRQHLNGDDAMGFVRFRHSDDDFHRTSRQRDFVISFKEALKRHWTQLPTVANQAVGLTGGVLSDPEIAYIAGFADKIGSDNIQMTMLPVVDAKDKSYDLRIDQDKATEVLEQYHFVETSPSASPVGSNP